MVITFVKLVTTVSNMCKQGCHFDGVEDIELVCSVGLSKFKVKFSSV